jgi:hypothetical protein
MVKTRKHQKKQRGGFFGFFETAKKEPPVEEKTAKPAAVEAPSKTPEQLAWQQQEAEIKRQIAEKRLAEPAQDNTAESAYITKHEMLRKQLKDQQRQETPTYMGGNRKSKRKSRKSRKSIKKSKNNKR